MRVVAKISIDASYGLLTGVGAGLSVLATMTALGIALRLKSESEAFATVMLTVLCTCMVAAGSPCLTYARQIGAREVICGTSAGTWSFETVSDPTSSPYGFRCRSAVRGDHGVVGDVWLVSKERLARGETLRIVGRVSRLRDDSYGRNSWAQGVCATVRVMSVRERSPARGMSAGFLRMRSMLLDCFGRCDPDTSATLAGCVCGAQEQLDERGLTDVFAMCGIAHMAAVSGAHLVVLGAVLTVLLDETPLAPPLRLATISLVTGCYVLVCGAPLSALRAWVMSVLASVGSSLGRRAHAASSVSIVGLSLMLASPPLAASLGFDLSVASVVGLALLSPHVTYLLRTMVPAPVLPAGTSHRWRRRCTKAYEAMTGALAATMVCQLVTLPLMAPAFGKVSLLAPIANLVAAPLVHALMISGLAAACLAATPAAVLPLRCCELVCRLLLWWLRALMRIPLCTVSVSGISERVMALGCIVPVVWLVWWPRVSRDKVWCVVGASGAMLALLYLRARYLAPARMVVLDVGQGDAILVQDGSHALLVDTGPDEAVVDALQRQGVVHLDAVLLTHMHDDHYGGLDDLVGVVGCDTVLVARGVADAAPKDVLRACDNLCAHMPQELAYGDELHLGGFVLRMVWPRVPVDGDENAESIELLLRFEGKGGSLQALLTGDAERDETGACVASGDVGDIDVLKVGHHGSEVSVDAHTARAMAPELSIASAGEGNSYGHPTEACQEVLRQAGSRFVCTMDAGDVEVRPTKDGFVVRTYGTDGGL